VEGREPRITQTLEKVGGLACIVEGEGPLALLAHGFPDGPSTFRHQVAALVARGYRVVRPWMRGYFPSALFGRYDIASLGEDLLHLGEHFSPGKPFVVVGHDWGALAAYAAAVVQPERISKLCTIAVPHPRVAGLRFLTPRQLRKSWYMGFFQLRFIAERRVRANDFRFIDELWRAWSPGYNAGSLDDVKAGFRDPAHLSAVLSYYRSIFSSRNGVIRKRTRVPSLYVHGVDDGCVGVELCSGVERGYASEVRVERISGAGHFVHLERADEFNRVLCEFLS
jgi:pimeloyl-ACP methyl ester carboxylesterase